MEAKRLAYIDSAKFIAIFLVAYCHIIEKGVTVPLLYSFHLPLFFFLSGVTLHVDKDTKFGDFLVRKLKSYLMPLFFVDLLFYLSDIIFLLVDHNYDAINYASFKTFMYDFFCQERLYSAWFIPALFFGVVFSYPLIKVTLKNKIPGILLSLVFLFFGLWFNKEIDRALPWNLDASFVSCFFVYCGYFFHQEMPQTRAFVEQSRISALGYGSLLMSINVILMSIAYHDEGKHLEMWGRLYEPFYLVIPSAVFGCLGMVLLSYAVSNKVFAYLGKMTLFILITQQEIAMKGAKNYWFRSWYLSLNELPVECYQRYLYALVVTLLAIAMGMGLYYLIRCSPFCVFYNYRLPEFYKKLFTRKKKQ